MENNSHETVVEFGEMNMGLRVVSDEAYQMACKILNLAPLPDREDRYIKWHRLSTVEWAKKYLTNGERGFIFYPAFGKIYIAGGYQSVNLVTTS